jgi:hypothetical protein
MSKMTIKIKRMDNANQNSSLGKMMIQIIRMRQFTFVLPWNYSKITRGTSNRANQSDTISKIIGQTITVSPTSNPTGKLVPYIALSSMMVIGLRDTLY